MPETTSPSPFISVMPRRSSGEEFNPRHVLEQYRYTPLALDDDLLQVGQALDIAAAAYRKLGFRKLTVRPPTSMLLVRSASRILASGMPSACSRRGSMTTLYCLTKPPTLRPWRRPRLGEAVADIPVLKSAARRGSSRAAHTYRRPIRRRSRRPRGSRDAGRKPPRCRAEIFQHARAGPAEVGAVLEDHVDERDPEEGETAHDPRLGDA